MKSVSQAIEMLDITDNKRELFNGLNKHRDYSLSKKKWINEVPSIHEISEKLLVSTKSLKKNNKIITRKGCLLYTSPSPRDKRQSRMPSSA